MISKSAFIFGDRRTGNVPSSSWTRCTYLLNRRQKRMSNNAEPSTVLTHVTESWHMSAFTHKICNQSGSKCWNVMVITVWDTYQHSRQLVESRRVTVSSFIMVHQNEANTWAAPLDMSKDYWLVAVTSFLTCVGCVCLQWVSTALLWLCGW